MKKKTLKCLMLSLGLATMTLAANNLNAQTGGGVFGKGGHEVAGESSSGFLDRSSSGIGYHISTEHFDNGGTSGMYHIGTQQFGQDVDDEQDVTPLGSGLFIMAAAGAAYAFKNGKRTIKNTIKKMKKLSAIIIAVAVVLGLGQCKKQETPATPNDNNNDTVYISVDVNNGGGKHYIEPNVGAYLFTDGDVLYVSNTGKYRGTLTYSNGAFDGYIVGASSSDYLYFYFLGGKAPAEAPVVGTTTSFTVSIADQSDNLPVLACAQSTYKFDPMYASYKAVLKNKCGLVKILPKEPTSAALTVGNMHNVAKIDFNPQYGEDRHRIEPTNATGGITLFSENENTKWAILLEQNEVINAPVTGEGYSNVTINIPEIDINMFSTEGIQMRYKVAQGQVSSVHWDFFSDGTLQLFGDGEVPEYAFDNDWPYISQVKRIECTGDNNNVDFFNMNAFVCNNNSQLTDIVINTRSSLRIAHNAFEFNNGGLPVDITINNFVVDGFGPDPFNSHGAPLSIYFGSGYAPNIKINNNAFMSLTSQDFVSIPYGCIGIVPTIYEFYDYDYQLDCLEYYIYMGKTAEEFIADNGLEEGEDYGVITQGYTINPITGGNANQIFGGAQVEIRY